MANDNTTLPEPITRQEMYLYAIAQNGGSGGAGLPAVTSDDNGDVLTVVNGVWAKAAPSGGGVFLVNIPYDDAVWTMDKTWTEIKAAFIAGMPVIVHIGDSEYYESQYYTVLGVREMVGDISTYVVLFHDGSSEYECTTTSADGYPEYVW